jgi:predicted acetylornithine/succinylornithine family transaminase
MTDTTLAPPAPALDPGLAVAELDCLAPLYPLPRLELKSGHGAWVTDVAGREYLDFTSGIAVNALGHVPPGLARRLTAQMRRLGHVSNLFANRPALELAQALCAATGYARAFFCNSGTEGIEAAIKFARARAAARGIAGRQLVAFRGGFHGRTAYALAATWTPAYREPFEPLVPGVRFASFNDVAALDDVLDEQVFAVLVEPVQGEGGAIPASRDFLAALRARSTALGAALIFDEVQCGMGRCGHLRAAEHYGVRADLTVLSKALGGGLPLGAVLMSEEVARTLRSGMHGCTFGGGPLAATAGSFVLERVARPAFLARVRNRGKRLLAGLDRLVAAHPSLATARGLGLLAAVELDAEAPFDPAALVNAARAHGLLLVRGGERAVRLLPPLTVTTAEIDQGLARLSSAITALESQGGTKR